MILTILLVSGILAAIAVFLPGSVTLGLYLLILPGLILAVAPTVFLYTAAFAGLRAVLPLPAGIAVNAAAALLTVALGFMLSLPGAMAGRAAFAAAIKPDIAPPSPVRIAGHVRLERWDGAEHDEPKASHRPDCDALCAALLDTPGVLSVTLAGRERGGADVAPVTYRLAAKADARAAPLAPMKPEDILAYLPKAEPAGGRRDWDAELAERTALQNAIKAKWALRLAGEQALVAEASRNDADLTIAITSGFKQGPHRIAVSEIELRDRGGQALMRQRHVVGEPIAWPFHVTPSGPMMDKGFERGRSVLHHGPRYFDFQPVQALFAATTLARPQVAGDMVAEMRARLAADLARPVRTGDIGLVPAWLTTLDWRKLTPEDVDLLGRLIADPAVSGLDRVYDGYASSVAPELRLPIARRLLDPATTGSFRYRLLDLVRNMPAGTYATLLPEEEAILANQQLRLVSGGLVERLADQGANAAPRLAAMLRADARVEGWSKRWPVLEAYCRAFTRLGPAAAGVLPQVAALLDGDRSSLTNSSGDAHAWRVATVRMGRRVEDVPLYSHWSEEQIGREREQLRASVARIEEKGSG